MSLRHLKLFTILLPPILIGGFEFIRHDLLLHYMSMAAGNFYITLLTLLLSYLFASWMFRSIDGINKRLAEEQAKRAVYEERERLARELHDNIAQTLFFLNVKLKQGQIEEARSVVSEIDTHVRQAIFNLRTSLDDGTAFTARLHKWLQDWSAITGIKVTESLDVPEGAFTAAEELQLFAIVQEAFTNIRKHSRASKADICLHAEDDGGWTLEIADNGIGIRDRDQPRHFDRYGMSLMQKRAKDLGASWNVEPIAEGGTRLTLRSEGGRTA